MHRKMRIFIFPALVSANIDWEKNNSEDNKKVKAALDEYGSTPYTVIERDGIRMGVYGILGQDAEECAPESGLEFEDIVEISKAMTEKLRKEKADLIVCLSHSGTSEKKEKSEDEILAKEVPEIDVIISGHTHTKLDEVIRHGELILYQQGLTARTWESFS